MYVLNNSMAFFPFTKTEKKVDFMAQRDWLMKRLRDLTTVQPSR